MPSVRRTDVFSDWLGALRDLRAKARILVRINRLALGNPGQVNSVGEGVSEMKIDYGPGYRVYFVSRGAELVVLLCGGDKDSQSRDVALAKRLSKTLEDEDGDGDTSA